MAHAENLSEEITYTLTLASLTIALSNLEILCFIGKSLLLVLFYF